MESYTPLNCPAGSYCPNNGSLNATACPPGFFCPGGKVTVPKICPENYFCPLGADSPRACYRGTYCPTGTGYPIPCPLGYRGVAITNQTSAVLYSLKTACERCPAGIFFFSPKQLTIFWKSKENVQCSIFFANLFMVLQYLALYHSIQYILCRHTWRGSRATRLSSVLPWLRVQWFD